MKSTMSTNNNEIKGLVFNIQGYSIHDGPGIRTTVFMKGCPLRCKWCANPESINAVPEILYNREKCIKCYCCVKACPHGAVSIPEEGEHIHINREICVDCEKHLCTKKCYQEALKTAGMVMTLEDLFKDIEKDLLFYRTSGGGVTLSGGEPSNQYKFASEFFKRCKEKGIHTVLDTTGFAPWERLQEILKFTDLVLYDIKHMDSDVHKKLTGVGNEKILENLKRIFSSTSIPATIRVPVIPGLNNSKENFHAIATFIKNLGAKEVNILPYHRMGTEKYAKLGKKHLLAEDIQSPEKKEMEDIKEVFESYGLNTTVGG